MASSHGCRHAHAQDRYKQITGYEAPCKFESKKEFRKNAVKIADQEWRKLNQDARQIIKAELGHGPGHDDMVSQYLGAIKKNYRIRLLKPGVLKTSGFFFAIRVPPTFVRKCTLYEF
jgi:hypothetical protein